MFYPRSNSCFIGYFFCYFNGNSVIDKIFHFSIFSCSAKFQNVVEAMHFSMHRTKKCSGVYITVPQKQIFFRVFSKMKKKSKKKSSKFALVVTIAPKLRRFWKGPPTLFRRSCRKKEGNTDRKRKKEEKRKKKKEKKKRGRGDGRGDRFLARRRRKNCLF